METNSIELNNVSKTYGQQILFNQTSFKFSPKSINIILGKNGVGKTTLLDLLSGDVEVDSGEIIGIKGRIFYLKFIPKIFDFDLVKDFLKFIKLSYGQDKIDCQSFKFIGPILNKRICELSTGEKQKVILSAALISKAENVLLDEPTNGIDKDFKKLLPEILNQILLESNYFIVTTHLPSDFENITNTKVVLNESKLKQALEDLPNSYRFTLHANNHHELEITLKEKGIDFKNIISRKDGSVELLIDINKNQPGKLKIIFNQILEQNIEILSFSKVGY